MTEEGYFMFWRSQVVMGSISKVAETSLIEKETLVSTLADSDPGPLRRKMAAWRLETELWRFVFYFASFAHKTYKNVSAWIKRK